MLLCKFEKKTLWHIQAVTDWHNEPYDMFLISEKEPTYEQCTVLYCEEQGIDFDDEEAQDFNNNCNIYSVYAEEV